MEALIFNTDFEAKLFQNDFRLQSSKKTQEFEYLINWIHPTQTIYTSKTYASDFRQWFEALTTEKFRTTENQNNIVPWCANFEQLELKKKLQDKHQTLEWAQKLGIGPTQLQMVEDEESLEPGYLYKLNDRLSGMGHFTYNDKEKILKELEQGRRLSKEPLLKRRVDFSSLWSDGEIKFCYENLITENFQYRGSLIGKESYQLPTGYQPAWRDGLKKIMDYCQGYRGHFSVDSFISDQGLYLVSEFNCRKTMGYCAYELKQKYFAQSPFMLFYFVRSCLEIEQYQKIYTTFNQSILPLSPSDHRFQCFLIAGENREDVLHKRKELSFRFF